MNISMELMDEMRKRTNCSYQEAKELLEKHQGDLVEAIIDFEKSHAHSTTYKSNVHGKRGWFCKIRELIKKGFVTRFIIEKEKNIILNIPVNILILAVIVTMPIIWLYPVAFIVLYFTGYKIRIRKEEGQDVSVNEIMDDIVSEVKTATDKMREKPMGKKQDNDSNNECNNEGSSKGEDKKDQDNKNGIKKEDAYNEITIE